MGNLRRAGVVRRLWAARPEILAGHEELEARLPVLRVNLAATVLAVTAQLPDGDFFASHNDTVLDPHVHPNPRVRLTARQFDLLKAATVGSVALWGLGWNQRLTGPLAAASYGALSGYVAEFVPSLWSYNTHLNASLLAAASIDMGRPGPDGTGRSALDRRAAGLLFMQLATASVYAQAGLSKVVFGRDAWLRTGDTLAVSLAALGTPAGARLARHRRLTRALSRAVVAGELSFVPVLLAGWRYRGLLAAGATGFHVATSRYLGITFWHLWSLYPGLFGPVGRARHGKLRVAPDWAVRQARRARRRRADVYVR